MLKSPALSVNIDDISTVKMPLTPRAPTSTEDPYGLKAQKQADNFDSASKDDDTANLIAKSEPVSKGKANFFSRLKKSTKPAEKTDSLSRPDIKIQVTAFDADEQPLSQDVDPSNMKMVGTSQAGQSVDPMDSPTLEKPKKASAKKSKFKLAVSTDHTGSAEPKKSPRRVLIDVNLDEELDALKEELEVFQMQLECEEDEAAQADWITEIERVTEAIAAKEQEISNKNSAEEIKQMSKIIESPSTPNNEPEVRIEVSEVTGEGEITLADTNVSDKLDQSPPKDQLTNNEGIQEEGVEAGKKGDIPDDDDKSPSKPKKKSNNLFNSRRYELPDEQAKEQIQERSLSNHQTSIATSTDHTRDCQPFTEGQLLSVN